MRLLSIFALVSTALVVGLVYHYFAEEVHLSQELRQHVVEWRPGERSVSNHDKYGQARPSEDRMQGKGEQNGPYRVRIRLNPSSKGETEQQADPQEDAAVELDKTPVKMSDLVGTAVDRVSGAAEDASRHPRGADGEEQAAEDAQPGDPEEGDEGEDALVEEEKGDEEEEDRQQPDSKRSGSEEKDPASEKDKEEEDDAGQKESEEGADDESEAEETAEDADRGSGKAKENSSEKAARKDAADKDAEDEGDEGKEGRADSNSTEEGDRNEARKDEEKEKSKEEGGDEEAARGKEEDRKEGNSSTSPNDSDDNAEELSEDGDTKRMDQKPSLRSTVGKEAADRKKAVRESEDKAGARSGPQQKQQQREVDPKDGKGTAASSARARSSARVKPSLGAKKGKKEVVRPALEGFNVTWQLLEGEEALYMQDVVLPEEISPGWQLVDGGSRGKAPTAELTAALARNRSREGIVLVTWASISYLDFLRNWVHHLSLLDVDNFIIGAMDQEIAAYLRDQQLPYFDMHGHQADPYAALKGHVMKGTKVSRTLAFNKIGVAQTLNMFGLDALMCDADVVWLRDPSHYFTGLEEADVLVATDALGPTNSKDDDGLESPEAILRSQMSTSLMFFRHGKGSRKFLDQWDTALRRNSSISEQDAFNLVARQGLKPIKTHPDNWRVFYGMHRSVTFGVLPASGFANGHTYFVQRLHDVMRVSPYSVHASYIFGGVAAKRNRLREDQIWLDGPSYYDVPKLLTIDIDVPAVPDNLQRLRNDYLAEVHLKMMQLQLDQLLVGFAMAITLNRTLVMPRLVCFCDRFWSPLERCRAPGASRLTLPFVCPVDHIFRPSRFTDDPALYGPPIAFREHSFLDHPDIPNSLKEQQVELLPMLGERKNLPQAELLGNQLFVPSNLTDDELRGYLEPYDNKRVLVVKNGSHIFREFSTREASYQFWRRIKHITGIWCCTYDGGVAYNMIPKSLPKKTSPT